MTVSRELLPTLIPADWDSNKPGPNTGFSRVRHLQSIGDLAKRPVVNRTTASTSNTVVNCDGTSQSSGIGTIPQTPIRYAEFTVKARVTLQIDSAGPAYVAVYRTLADVSGNGVPVNGAAPNAGDVIVGGDAFMGGATVSGVNQSGAFSFLDTGLSQTTRYLYYLVVTGPNGSVLQLLNSSQLLVMERS